MRTHSNMAGQARMRGFGRWLRTRAGIVTAAAAVAVVAAATAATAYVSASGTGTATVTVNGKVTMNVTVDTDGGTSAGIGDGFGPGLVKMIDINVANPNNRDLQVQELVQDGTASVKQQPHPGPCDGSVVTVVTGSGLPVTVPARDNRTIAVPVVMANEAGAGCQGASFAVKIKVMGRVL